MSEVVANSLGLPADQISVVSGPNLAREIASKHPTATVVASSSQQTAELVARACANSYFRPYTNLDVVGVELCGAVKNVIALAVGVDRKSTRLNSSHVATSYAVFCLKKKRLVD